MRIPLSNTHTHTQVELWDPGRQNGRLDKCFPAPSGRQKSGGGRGERFIFILSV